MGVVHDVLKHVQIHRRQIQRGPRVSLVSSSAVPSSKSVNEIRIIKNSFKILKRVQISDSFQHEIRSKLQLKVHISFNVRSFVLIFKLTHSFPMVDRFLKCLRKPFLSFFLNLTVFVMLLFVLIFFLFLKYPVLWRQLKIVQTRLNLLFTRHLSISLKHLKQHVHFKCVLISRNVKIYQTFQYLIRQLDLYFSI